MTFAPRERLPIARPASALLAAIAETVQKLQSRPESDYSISDRDSMEDLFQAMEELWAFPTGDD